jgi:hypothetical protein
MPLITCPDCGQQILDAAPACIHCGRPVKPLSVAATASVPTDPAPVFSSGPTSAMAVSSPPVDFPLFPVATHKFIILSICSFSMYELYWCYQNWRRLSDASREAISPFWRAFFAPLWGFSLFRQIQDLATSEGIVTRWNSTLLGTLYLVLSVLWRLPDPWWLVSFATFVPMMPVQRAAQRLNDHKLGVATEDRNARYTGWNIAMIVGGGLLFVLALVGMFIPE